MSLLLLFLPSESGDVPPPLQDQYIRLVDNWELSYSLGGTPTFRCLVVDKRTDKENAYRPPNDSRVEVRRGANLVIFRGRIVTTGDAPLEEPNVGTKYSIACIGESEVFESRFYTGNFGSDPIAIYVTGVDSGGVVTVVTVDPHGFSPGNTVFLEGLTPNGGTTLSPINGERTVISVIDAVTFTIGATQPYNSFSGTVRKQIHLRDILQELEDPYLTDYGYSLAPDIALGPLLEVQKFEDASINDIFRQLSKITGWVHRYIPNDRIVEWFEPGTKVSALSFSKSNTMAGTGWTQNRVKKANTIIFKYGGNQQVAVTESISGDGVKREWPLVHKPIVNKPLSSTSAQLNLVVNSPSESGYRHVGIYGLDTLFEYVYRESDNTLVQLATSGGGSNAVKGVDWTAAVYINEQLPGTVRVSDPDLIIAQGGIREKKVEATGIVDRNTALQMANKELEGLGVDPKEAKLVTEEGLTWPGNSTEVDLPHLLMTGQFLITSVTAVETERSLRYTYTAFEGNEFRSTWQERLKNLFGGGGSSSSSSVISGSVATSPGGGGTGSGIAGTTGKIPVFASPTTLGDSVITQSTDGNLVSTPAAIQADQGFKSNIFQGITAGGVDAVFRNAAGLAVFDVPTTTRNARFYGDVVTGKVTSETDLTLGSTNNVVYPTGNYQTHLGGISRKWLTLHAAELYVEQLVAQDTISTIGGSLLITPTSTLEADVTAAATSILVKHNHYVVGNQVLLKTPGQIEIMTITGGPTGTGPYLYTVTRNVDGSGANNWNAGDAVAKTDAFIDLYSMRGTKSALEVGPTIVGNVRTSTAAFGWGPRWALGNLHGIYSFGVDTYGAAFGDPNGNWIVIEPIFGLRMGYGGNASGPGNVRIDTAGNASFSGTVTSIAGAIGGWTIITGYLFSGATSIARVGLHASDVATDVAIYAGDFNEGSAPFRVLHNGSLFASNATITGSITATSGNITAALVAGSITATHIASATITADKLNVGTLSAISANLGTVTAGTITGITINGSTINGSTINGSTINAGSGSEVVLNSSGITIVSADNSVNRYKFTNGSYMSSKVGAANILDISSAGDIWLQSGAGRLVQLTGSFFGPGGGNACDLGSASAAWQDLHISRDVYFHNLAGGGDRQLRIDNNGLVYATV